MPLRTAPSASRSLASPLASKVRERATVGQLALGRAAAGASMIVRPTMLPRLMGVDSAAATRLGWSVQMLGAREVAVGLGTLASVRGGDRRATRTWVAAGVLCDAVDALAMTGALLRGRVGKGAGAATLAVALGAVAIGLDALQSDEADI